MERNRSILRGRLKARENRQDKLLEIEESEAEETTPTKVEEATWLFCMYMIQMDFRGVVNCPVTHPASTFNSPGIATGIHSCDLVQSFRLREPNGFHRVSNKPKQITGS